MSIFQWRIFGGRTLAYLLDGEEVRRLLDYGPGLGPQEALLVKPPSGEATSLLPDSPEAESVSALEELILTPGGEARVLFISDGPAESMRHMAFSTRDGHPVRVALKLLFKLNPLRPGDLFDFLGKRLALSDAEIDAVVGAKAEESLAVEVSGLAVETLRQQPQVQERIKLRIIEEVREYAAGLGLKINGLGLAWGFDESRMERMSAAAEKSASEEALFADERREALKELRERRGLPPAEEESPPVAKSTLPESLLEGDSLFLSGDATENAIPAEPDRSPEPPSAPVGGRPMDPASILGPADVHTKPIANWHLFGRNTIASILDEEAVPRIFRKDFTLGDAEAGAVIGDGKVIDVISRGLERTGSALLWVRRLFCRGDQVLVLFFNVHPFQITVDLEGFDATREDVRGTLTLRCRLNPRDEASVRNLLDSSGRLTLHGLEERLGPLLSEVMGADLRLIVADKAALKGMEGSLKYSIEREMGRMGLEVLSLAFDWVHDRDSYVRHKELHACRAEERMAAATRRSVEDVGHAIYLEQRRIEDLKALQNLEPAERGEVYRMLLRAAFGVAALNRSAPTADEIEKALAASRERVDELKGKAAKVRSAAEEALRRGFVPAAFIVGERFTGGGEESYLSTEDEGEFLGDGADFDEQIDFFGKGQPTLLKPSAPLSVPEQTPSSGGGRLTRCPKCMSPVRGGTSSCGNCGVKL